MRPPLGKEIPERRLCSRDLDFPNGVPCAKEGFLHICWDANNFGFVCEGHASELGVKGWTAYQVHEMGPDCGMPESLWDFDANRCFVPDDTPTAITTTDREAVPA